MRVFVAGATGTLGRAVVRELVSRGHEVTGMTRSPSKRSSLEAIGARAAVADALEEEAVTRVIRDAEPEGVVSVLTSLPRRGPLRGRDLEPTNRLRDEGTRNVTRAAIAAGARRLVGESIVVIYGYSVGSPAGEGQPPGRETERHLRRAIEAITAGERHVREATDAGRIEGISLRFGFYHGPEAPNSRYLLELVRRRRMPLIGGGRGVHSWIEVADAARAVAYALEHAAPGSVYNVVDDAPVEFRSYLCEMARLAGAPPPRRLPYWLAASIIPYGAMFLDRARVAASNEKLRRELGWEPRHPTFREALAALTES